MTLADHLQSKKEILSNRFLNVIFYACGCFASMHVCAPHAYLVSWSPKESTGSLGTEDTDLCALPCECWELHSGRAPRTLNHPVVTIQPQWLPLCLFILEGSSRDSPGWS